MCCTHPAASQRALTGKQGLAADLHDEVKERTAVRQTDRIWDGEAVAHVQLPASFFAYRKQQHRWTCGPVQLWRRAAVDIWASSLPMSAKLELIVAYFGIRKFATHWVSLGFFCTLVPLSMFTPEVRASTEWTCLLHLILHRDPLLATVFSIV